MSTVAPPVASASVRRRWRTAYGRVLVFWASLDQEVSGRRVPGSALVGLIALTIAGICDLIAFHTSSNTWYADSVAHATIARRIFDDKAPGFQQLGTVWLPLPHLLLMPFVASRTLWSTGLGASFLGALCSAATATAVYRITARLGFGRGPRLVAVAVLVTNVNYEYICTTALTEPVLIAAFACTIAGLTHWATAARPMSGGELAVYAGLPAMVAMLSRYEGWVLVIAMVMFVAIVEYRRVRPDRPRPLRFVLTHRILPVLSWPAFGLLAPFVGIGWWFAYNFNIYGNALEFMTGPYSALAQQADYIARGQVTTHGDLGVSLSVYSWSVWEILGGFVVVTGALGGLVVAFVEGLSVRTLTLALALSTYVFMVASLYLGQTVIWNDHSLPPAVWNVRFAVSPIVFFSIGLAALLHYLGQGATRWRPTRKLAWTIPVLAVLPLVGQACWVSRDVVHRAPVVTEGFNGAAQRPAKAIAYLKAHYDGGNILLNETAGSSQMIPLVGLPNKDYWDLSTGAGYQAALRAPTTHARWIVVRTARHTNAPDPTWVYMRDHPELYASYHRVLRDGEISIFRLDDGPTS
jgi:hypothetical protein